MLPSRPLTRWNFTHWKKLLADRFQLILSYDKTFIIDFRKLKRDCCCAALFQAWFLAVGPYYKFQSHLHWSFKTRSNIWQNYQQMVKPVIKQRESNKNIVGVNAKCFFRIFKLFIQNIQRQHLSAKLKVWLPLRRLFFTGLIIWWCSLPLKE